MPKHAFFAAKGFTLIEVLIAMTLLSIMVVLLFASLKICADSWEKGERKIAAVNETAVVYNFFQRHLSVAKPLSIPATTENGIDSFAFQGGNQGVQFVSSFPASANKTGLQLFSVEWRDKNQEQFIEVTMRPFFSTIDGQQWRDEKAVLLKHVKKFRVSYFGSEDGMSEGMWQEEWLDKSLLPQLVKINIDLDDNAVLPEMVIALRTNASHDPAEGGEVIQDDAEQTEETEEEVNQ